MNRFINLLLIFILLPSLLFTIIVGFDIPVSFLRTSGANMPNRDIVFISVGLLILVLNLRRSIRRWMGMRVVNRVDKFKWNVEVSVERKKRVTTYLILESLLMIAVAIGFYEITPEAWMIACGFMFGGIDSIVFMIVGLSGRKYRVGLSSKALIIADREVSILYFTGLRQVSVHQQSVYFDYIKGLQLFFPLDSIPAEKRNEFFELLEKNTDRDKVYFIRKQETKV